MAGRVRNNNIQYVALPICHVEMFYWINLWSTAVAYCALYLMHDDNLHPREWQNKLISYNQYQARGLSHQQAWWLYRIFQAQQV